MCPTVIAPPEEGKSPRGFPMEKPGIYLSNGALRSRRFPSARRIAMTATMVLELDPISKSVSSVAGIRRASSA
ncbi:MAG: hypothetical protein BWY88_00332 [Synergistetes bacterium ADurb.Bin520]|nr:MAG: hypothetical protein BWY88_00332 [Synergistetes bacterium ADurb.Bin520]